MIQGGNYQSINSWRQSNQWLVTSQWFRIINTTQNYFENQFIVFQDTPYVHFLSCDDLLYFSYVIINWISLGGFTDQMVDEVLSSFVLNCLILSTPSWQGNKPASTDYWNDKRKDMLCVSRYILQGMISPQPCLICY